MTSLATPAGRTARPGSITRTPARPGPGPTPEALLRALDVTIGRRIRGLVPGEFRARPGLGDRRHTPLSLEDLERQHIERTLKHHTGNRTRAAIELGISRATLINKIKRYNISA